MLLRCGRRDCDQPATWRWVWEPGGQTDLCEAHARQYIDQRMPGLFLPTDLLEAWAGKAGSPGVARDPDEAQAAG